MKAFRIEEIELRHPALAGRPRPLTFALLSDLHLRRWGPEHARLAQCLRERPADLCFVTGDLFTRAAGSRSCARRFLSLLHARHGVFMVRGNWDATFGPPLRRLREMAREAHVTLLCNEVRTVDAGGTRVCVGGLDDLNYGAPDLQRAVPRGEADGLAILLSHAPLAARLLPRGHGVDLVLCGHTHGGQVRVPLLWRLLLPAASGGFVSGLYRTNGTWLYVSRGFGGVGPVPLRLDCPPEVTFFRVLAAR